MKLNAYKLSSKHVRKVSGVLLTVMLIELVSPLKALALTSGPSQPEFQGFTPLATTSLVDPFSGDFSYNIPLLDIEGYPLNLVYRATSNIEEEGSWVGYGWNVNVGTLNRMVRGLPDDMNGELIKSYQNIKEREVKSIGIAFEPNISFNAKVTDGIGLSVGVQSTLGFTKDEDNYTGRSIGVSVGGGVYAGIQAGPFSVGGSAGVTLSANSSTGGSISTYAGFNAGVGFGEYCSVGFGKSVNRTFNTISGWSQPMIVGSFSISNVTREIQKSFINSVSNEIPQVSVPYKYTSDGKAYRLDLGFELGLIEGLGLDMGLGITVNTNKAVTTYNSLNVHKGYGYMYSENASDYDMLDFTRDNDGGLNKEMPFLPPAMKTFDVFNSTAHGASSTFRADRNDLGVVRDPRVIFDNTAMKNKMHQVTIKAHMSFTCWIGVSVKYDNVKTTTDGEVRSGGCVDDMVGFGKNRGQYPNLYFRPCGATSLSDELYLSQVNRFGFFRQSNLDVDKDGAGKRPVIAEPIAVYTNSDIAGLPQTVIPKTLENYTKNTFPINQTSIKTSVNRGAASKIGAILNTNKAGQTYVYATPVNNNVKNDVAFRVSAFNTPGYSEREGLMSSGNNDNYASQFNGQVRDNLYKNTLTPAYATSYLLNAVLSPDYIDVKNDGITDDDLGGFVKFNYTKTEEDYRWRVPYGDKEQNVALLNRGVKLTAFDDMGSYTIGSKEVWYAQSIESKNNVAEFYLSDREDALDSRSKIMRGDHPHAISNYTSDKSSFAHMQRLDSIKYYDKHDRFINQGNAVPLKTIYFDYDYGISSGLPNSGASGGGKLRLVKVRVRHANEPIEFAETYDLGYSSYNPSYSIGKKDGWGNYCNNDRPLPMCEFPYIDQQNRTNKDRDASAFHLNHVGLPSGGNIDVEYEADDYAYVQNKRAMALTEVAGVGSSPNLMPTDAFGLYDHARNPFLYIFVKKPSGLTGDYKNFLLNGSDLMYFSFHINIAGDAFSTYDQVKGYAEVETIGDCPNASDYIYIKVKPVNLTKTNVKPSPMVNTAINMARAFASDQLYYQEQERADGKNYNHLARLKKAANQVADAIFGKNSIAELMKDYKAAHRFVKDKSYVKLALTQPKIGGGSRVSKITFDDEWSSMISGESNSLIGYKYSYIDRDGLSSGVASYEPTMGGEENPLRSGRSYRLSSNQSKYPPFDPVELLKEDPAGESFLPTGSVGYSRIIIESIHKAYARSAQSKLVQEFYTAKDFPYVMSYGTQSVEEMTDKDYPNPGLRDILLSFLGYSKSSSSSANAYKIRQEFLVETNDMHGKPKATYKYRLLPKDNKEEMVSSTEYYYHGNGNGRLNNDVEVILYKGLGKTTNPNQSNCVSFDDKFPKANVFTQTKTLGVDIDISTDSREVLSTETRHFAKIGGGLKICLPPSIRPKFNWIETDHTHTDYFRATTTTKIINRYGILRSVRTVEEGAETIVENKYYDAVTGQAVVQVVKDKYGDNQYSTNVPAYWTKTDLEPAYADYPYFGAGSEASLPESMQFTLTPSGFISGSNLLQASFETSNDIYHPGDELFVEAKTTKSDTTQWRRLYVVNVTVKKNNWSTNSPLGVRHGNGTYPDATYKVYVTPYKINNQTGTDITAGDYMNNISSMIKFRSGRRNMLELSAGTYKSLRDPFVADDTVARTTLQECLLIGLRKPVINANANRYESVNTVKGGTLTGITYNPVSAGILNQPYPSATYALFGDRISRSANANMMEQRKNGIVYNWYYWQPDRYDSVNSFVPLKSMLVNYNNFVFLAASSGAGNANWFAATEVTKSIPAVGPVEEKNALGIYNSIFLSPVTKKVMHVTTNGKFGQTWVESFEDMRHIRKYNQATDFVFSLFQKDMSKSTTLVPNYEVFNTTQNLSGGTYVQGSFVLDNGLAHTGIYSLRTTGLLTVKTTANKYANSQSYSEVFDFNLDNSSNQKYTYEVWVKNTSGSITPPSITINTTSVFALTAVSNAVDGWVLYRYTMNVNDGNQVAFKFPSGQYYDDIRVYPAMANVKSYVYHPFKTYLMAILDENNYATYYEYNNRNQLVRLKKETEKGIITITENIKNIKSK